MNRRRVLGVAALLGLAAVGGAGLVRHMSGARRAVARFGDPLARGSSALEVAEPCARCHEAEAAAWRGSQHARACRAFDPARDAPPPGAPAAPVAIIGLTPLRQALLPAGGGRLQVFDPALDPRSGEWFSIFGAEQPRPGQWGHWTGGGMTWNAQCAACHTTDLQKGYDAASDSYRTTWGAMGIACTQCHGELTGHGEGWTAAPVRAAALRGRASDACGACHGRHEELTGSYRAGEPTDERFRLLLADEPDLYHPDGRAKDEVFELGSLRLSRMGAAGVTCVDCHDPHSGGLRASIDDDALCLGCHAPPGQRGAVAIDAPSHTHHAANSRGARCVECHMPTSVYMARDARRDHGFTSPDPLLARELGAPDACTACHADRDADWSVGWVERWYGAAMDRPARRRARVVARAQRLDRSVAGELAALARAEPNDAWRASLVGLLRPFADDVACRASLVASLDDASARVRAAAVPALARVPEVRPRLVALRHDPARVVRLAAAWATRAIVADDAAAHAEMVRWLEVGADQPAGALRQSELALVERRAESAVAWAEKAVRWDPSGPSFHTLARALVASGKPEEARAALRRAEQLLRAPGDGAR